MPKVKKEYFKKKENQIVDATMRVCQSKPAYEVTLRDIVRECKISQGSIYCYFSDIDEIFAAILNRCHSEIKFEEDTEKIFEQEERPEVIIESAFTVLGQNIDKIVERYGNLIYELNAIYMNNQVRGEKMQNLVDVSNAGDMFLYKLLAFIEKHISNGDFQPTIPKAHILLLISVAFQGIMRTATFTQNAQLMQEAYGVAEEYATAQGMASILSQVVIGILKNNNLRGNLK